MTQDILQALKSIKTATELEDFEGRNRNEIIEGSVELRYALDARWKELKGAYYFQPVTTIQAPRQTIGSHPKLTRYRTVKRALGITWKRITEPRKAGNNRYNVDFYHIVALTDGGKQVVGWKLDREQVIDLCGRKTWGMIEKAKGLEGLIENLNEQISCVGYWEVVFHPKSHENDTPDVHLNANGLALQMQREKPVIVPGTHLNVADDGVWLKYHEEPGVTRKVVGKIQFYGYTVLREATEEEYLAQKAEGDKIEAEEKRKKEAM